MSASRTMLYFLGIVLVIVAISVFFFTAGLNRWIPVSMLAAGILLIIGLSVMGFAEDAPERSHGHVDEHGTHSDGGDVTIVKK
jgi:uncharacterized membrane protein